MNLLNLLLSLFKFWTPNVYIQNFISCVLSHLYSLNGLSIFDFYLESKSMIELPEICFLLKFEFLMFLVYNRLKEILIKLLKLKLINASRGTFS